MEGVFIQLPLSYPELKELGFYVDGEDEEYIANESEYYYPTVYGPDGEEIGYVYLGNETEEAIPLKDCVVFGFWFTSSYLDYGEVSFSFANGSTYMNPRIMTISPISGIITATNITIWRRILSRLNSGTESWTIWI